MNKIIKVNSLGLSNEIRKSIECIVDQLEKNNYALSPNPLATRKFAGFIPRVYKRNGIIQIKSGIIAVKPDYIIERCDIYSFRIKIK